MLAATEPEQGNSTTSKPLTFRTGHTRVEDKAGVSTRSECFFGAYPTFAVGRRALTAAQSLLENRRVCHASRRHDWFGACRSTPGEPSHLKMPTRA